MGILSWPFGSPAPQGTIDGPGTFDIEVVGESNYQRALTRARGRAEPGATVKTVATLVLEDSNPHDKMAVRVEIEGQVVGYLDRQNARAYRAELIRVGHPRLIGSCAAKICGGKQKRDGSREMYGVWLDMPANG